MSLLLEHLDVGQPPAIESCHAWGRPPRMLWNSRSTSSESRRALANGFGNQSDPDRAN